MPLSRRSFGLLSASTLSVLGLASCGQSGSGGGTTADGGFDPGNRITMIVPFSAGGGSDQSGRAMATGLEEATGKNITVENQEGGSGAVGYSNLLGANGDASVLLASETAMIALPLTQDVEFTYESFTPIMKLGDDYTLVVVKADSAFQALPDVIAAAKSAGVVAAVSGATSLDEVVFSLIEQDQGVTFDRIPYESGGEVLTGLLGGHVELASLNPSEVMGQLESGELRALAAIAPERYTYDALKDIPTGIEQGIDVAFAQFRGFIAPGGIAPEARQYWIDAAKAYSESEAADEYLASNFMQKDPVFGDDFVAYLGTYTENLSSVLETR